MLPRSAIIFGVIDDALPLCVVHRHFDEIEIRPIVTVPQQQFEMIDDADRAQLNDDTLIDGIGDHVSGVAFLHVVRSAVVVEQRLTEITLNDLGSKFR